MAIFNRFAGFILIPLFLIVSVSSCTDSPEKTEEKIILKGDEDNAPEGKTAALTGGAKIYADNCNICHGPDGKKQLAGAKDLSVSTLSIEQRIQQITEGKTTGKSVMPAYRGTLTAEQIKEVALYLDLLKK